VKEHNRYEPDKNNWIKVISTVKKVPLEKVYDFLIKKHVVKDR